MLKIEDLHVYYGEVHALRGVSLEVRRGEVVALLGNNGAGKTTTLRSISGMLASRQGKITLEGAPVTGVPAHDVVRMGIAHVPEGRRIFKRLTVKENLALGAFLRNDADVATDTERMLTLFPILRERLKQVAGTLSGGEQQMLAVGRALMTRPQLLLLDEPSMGLSPVLVERIFDTIVEVNRQGTTILLVEQNASMALAIASRAYVLETGAIVL
jgi:branched-chain amino acid transport system ATP-binding protein